ncbi:MAG: hypothetical protein HQM09_04115 [Candidatus Riflebacteria bacterium]|nr:hypothetical protein [Candidatus Riflebacteria bacterium]
MTEDRVREYSSHASNIIKACCILAIGILVLYAVGHPFFEEPLPHLDLLPVVLGKGLVACLLCLLGIFLIEGIGRGVLAFGNLVCVSGLPLACGILWIAAGSIILLSLGLLKWFPAFLLLAPFIFSFFRTGRFFEGTIFCGIHWSSWLAILLFGAVAGAIALAPSVSYDDHVYHLQAINDFQARGTLWYQSHQPNIYRPMGHAAFMAWLRILCGETIGGLANVLFMIAAALLVSNTSNKISVRIHERPTGSPLHHHYEHICRNSLIGIIGTLAWVSNPQLMFFAGSTYSEPFLCLVFLLILHVLVVKDDFFQIGSDIPESINCQKPERKDLSDVSGVDTVRHTGSAMFFVGGLLAGLLPGIKYTGILLVPVPFIVAHPSFASGIPFKNNYLPLILGFILAFVFAAFPFYIRNGVITGNPVYPHVPRLFYGVSDFPGVSAISDFMKGYTGSETVRSSLPFEDLATDSKDLIDFAYQDFTDRFGMGRDPVSLLMAPWNVVLHGHFHNSKYPLQFFDGQLSPFFLVTLFLLLFIALSSKLSRNKSRVLLLFSCSIWMLAGWLSGSHQIRFLMPLVAFSAWAVPWLFSGISRRQLFCWIIIAALSSCWAITYGVSRIDRVAPFVAGKISENEYYAASIPFFNCFAWANANLPESAKTLVLLEECSYLLKKNQLWTGLLPHTFVNFLYRCGSAETAERILRKHGITHIFIPSYGKIIFSEIQDSIFQTVQSDFFSRHLKSVYNDGQYEFFAWAVP